ncbi:transcriptional regulator [Rhodococcoides trifolii]|uniref:Transcriptional regulator n=1 Tax=Rhodococcoides trifolii TaxID=908250 RepID=A0A917G5C6_9NOCA|nr:AraC family transcriptional regulator [Rhodococcus trifolii]GGG22598.1 transcriptional regulator [Rhodococcus trifolii]
MTTETSRTGTIPVDFVRAAVVLATETGVDLSSCLRAADIDERTLARDDMRLTTEQVTAFTRATWQLTGDELVGLGSEPVRRGTFRVICLTLIHCPDLGTALTRMNDVIRVFPGVPQSMLLRGEHTTRLEIEPTTTLLATRVSPASAEIASRLQTDFLLILWHRFSAWLVGRRVKLTAVEMPYAMPGTAAARTYDDIFGARVSFGSDVAALEFETSILRSPIVQNEDSLDDYLRESPNLLFSERDYGSSAASLVRRVLETGARGRTATATDIADVLSVSAPHLRRLLRQEGTSLGELREEVLRDMAVAGLGRGESVDELSARLGFSEPSAFRRAFKRWTGATPGAYR